jgi:hypothetical protein
VCCIFTSSAPDSTPTLAGLNLLIQIGDEIASEVGLKTQNGIKELPGLTGLRVGVQFACELSHGFTIED